jgi:hypothetical protein
LLPWRRAKRRHGEDMTMTKSALVVSSIVLALTGMSACSHDSKPAEYNGAPGASAPARELKSAVTDISDARCDLEQRCNNIGAGQSFDNREACETKMHGSLADDLNTKDCPHGVDHSKLSACLGQLKSEECGNPMDSMSRWEACRQGELCIND